ncbi:MAG: hypothetical protein Q8Q09_28340, partial [Deltaproteobacteria bacterium]|nr:hypothetical protein [Deltaproteobacteria bacterium]
TACAAGQVCSMGVCTLSCSAGQTNCSDSCVSLPSDPSHCGACGTVCGPYANAIASCGASTCIMTCNAGFADCNAMRGDGCEINQNTDVNNCGRCGNRCSFPNATAGCGAGACQLVSCNAGFENADGIAANGCEQRVFRAGTMGSPFGDGTLRGLTDDPMAGGITPSGMVSTTTANFLWIVNVNESSISKWDANMATELARYRVGIPAGECVNQCCHANGCNMPSRVVVDGNGDVYIANRAFGMQGTVTKIAGDRRDCIDRNGNGMIDTSTGATNVLPFTIAAGMGMGQPADECVLWTANVGPVNDVLRALAIDRGDATSPNGSPWVGNCNGTMRMYKLNSRTGAITNTLSAGASGCLYGAVGTADGRVWFHNSSTSLIPVNTLTNTVEAAVPINQPSGCRSTYGITADGAGRIWLSTPGCNDIAGYRPSDNTWTSVPVGFVTGLGITSDSAGNIWTHKWSNGDTLVRFPASAFVAGGFVPAAMVQRIPTGRAFGATSAIGADLTGTMWFVSYDLPSTLVRYVPSTNVFTNFAGPNRPYSYTDFTGSVRRTAIPQGTWERTIDLGCANPNVSSVVIDATAPMDTAITLTARSAATVAGLAAATDVSLGGAPPVLPVYNVSTPYILAGQTIGQQFRLTLLLRAAMSGANPLVRSVRVNWTCP